MTVGYPLQSPPPPQTGGSLPSSQVGPPLWTAFVTPSAVIVGGIVMAVVLFAAIGTPVGQRSPDTAVGNASGRLAAGDGPVPMFAEPWQIIAGGATG